MSDYSELYTRFEGRLQALEAKVGTIEKQRPQLPAGKPGTGACICRKSPAYVEREMQRLSEPPHARFEKHYDMLLDHRCAQHGEKAQPAAWGRHKELELSITCKQWESLGVTYDKVAAP